MERLDDRPDARRESVRDAPGEVELLAAAGFGHDAIPAGTEQLRIVEVRYERISVDPFSPPPGAEAAPRLRSRTGG